MGDVVEVTHRSVKTAHGVVVKVESAGWQGELLVSVKFEDLQSKKNSYFADSYFNDSNIITYHESWLRRLSEVEKFVYLLKDLKVDQV